MGFVSRDTAFGLAGDVTYGITAQAVTQAPSEATIAPSAGRRLMVYSAWLALSVWMEAAAADKSVLRTRASVFEDSAFGDVGYSELVLAAPAAGVVSDSVSLPIWQSAGGLLLPIDARITLQVYPNRIAGTDPQSFWASGTLTVFATEQSP